jgi:DNA modification methylase
MVEVFRELRRVLRPDGTLWLNCGDSYYNYRTGYNGALNKQSFHKGPNGKPVDHEKGLARRALKQDGLKEKDLVGIPWRLAFALQADGWWLRQDIIWHKPNPMPESVTDRCTKAHEYIFLMTKSARYFWDAEAVKEQSETEPHSPGWSTQRPTDSGPMERRKADGTSASQWDEPDRVWGNGTRNKRSVWTIPSNPYSEAHFATFPPDLIKPCILAGTSARGCCPKCGAPWERVVDYPPLPKCERQPPRPKINGNDSMGAGVREERDNWNGREMAKLRAENPGITSWKPGCDCAGMPDRPGLIFEQQHPELTPMPCTVLDPFGGSGTTGMVALELGRKAILVELNPEYVKLAEQRCFVTPGLALA